MRKKHVFDAPLTDKCQEAILEIVYDWSPDICTLWSFLTVIKSYPVSLARKVLRGWQSYTREDNLVKNYYPDRLFGNAEKGIEPKIYLVTGFQEFNRLLKEINAL